MFKKLRYLKNIVALLVIAQFGFFIPLSPVLGQMVQEESPNTEAATLDMPVIQEADTSPAIEENAEIPDNEPTPALNENNVEILPQTVEINEEIIKEENLAPEVLTPEATPSDAAPIQVISEDNAEADIVEKEIKNISYTGLMRDLKDVRIGKSTDKKNQVFSDFESFITAEQDRLDSLNISREKKKNYLNRLEGQLKGIEDKEPSTGLEKIWEKVKTWLGLEAEELVFDEEIARDNEPEVKIPESPAEFSFNQEIPKLQNLGKVEVSQGQKIDQVIKAFITIEEAKADSGALPVLADVQGDGGEIIINSAIKNLASDLHNNPVEIYNFVRENINYEPYFGAKKGNLGCLEEKVCNDVDAASLSISLLRAAGIPAHYKKSIMVVSADELQEMLGLDKTVEARRTIYGVFGWNKVPIFSITDNPTVGQNLDGADFSTETHFALEWVFPEAYYDYDERGGNIPNLLDLSTVSTTSDLQALLQEQYKKQWIALDVIFKDYTRAQKEIVADTAGFNAQNFWYGFYQYQGSLSPLNKYISDLQTATGKNVSSTAYHSFNIPSSKAYEILPPTLPYVLGSGVDSNGNQILPETWSNLPEIRKQQVKIQLKNFDNQVVLEHTFFGSEINNSELNLYYEGATDDDKAVIESYGGIHATPAELVDIRPYLSGDYERYDTTENISIGDSLKLRFEYYINGIKEHDDEKFSTAGNQEGIYVVLSRVQEDPYSDTNSRILLRGNVGIAREYLARVQRAGELYEKSLDYNYNINFSRAVVTQNRILNTVNGAPTTFDFKGLTIDAGTYINDWSNRGNYKIHKKDFRLLWGLEASYQEGQIFTDVAGLEGISTVKGLQYAYAHPADYSVQTITSSTESIIDTLALSDNTKANMHADVQKGNTIITPNKFVSDGNWNGIFYVSLDPEWTGTYAIGEQTQSNGGWTINDFLNFYYYDEDNNLIFGFYYDQPLDLYYYEDVSKAVDSVQCKLSKMVYNTIKASANWSDFYGYPCFMEDNLSNFGYGDIQHSFVLASNGAYFYSPGRYDYWVTRDDVKMVLSNDKNLDNIDGISDIKYYENFKFNLAAGTYSVTGHYDGSYEMGWNEYCQECLTAYYEPNENGNNNLKGYGRVVFGRILVDGLSEVIRDIGFPVSNRHNAQTSGFGTRGKFQNFIGGQIYYDMDEEKTFAVLGKMSKYHNENDGTWGKFGFPVGEPRIHSHDYDLIVEQDFEGTRIVGNGTVIGGQNIDDVTHLPVWYKSVWYGGNDYYHYLIVDLNFNLENRACFKHLISKDYNGDYFPRDFDRILNYDSNRFLHGVEPIGAVNGDYFSADDGSLLGVNYSLGVPYVGTRNWTTMAISPNNDVLFVSRGSSDESTESMAERIPTFYKYNVIAGGPKIITNGKFTDKTCSELLGKDWAIDHMCYSYHDQRTVIGVTEDNYMIILVTSHGPFEDLYNLLNKYQANYGQIVDANMYDGGGSPAMMFDGDIKRKDKPIVSSLMVYTGSTACGN